MKYYVEVTVLLFLIALLWGCPVHAATYNVNTTTDELDGSCADDDCSIRDAIQLANGDATVDTINIAAGIYSISRTGTDDTNSLGDFDISKPVNIVGAGAGLTIIDPVLSNRIFHVINSSVVSIEGVKLYRGNITGKGGCKYLSQIILTI